MSDNPSETSKSNKGIIIVIIAISFLFLVGIGIALYFFFGKKIFNPSPPPPPPPPVSPPVSPPSGGTGATGGTGGTGATGGTSPSPINQNTYLFIREYGPTSYPSYLSVRMINNKRYLVANYIATPENSSFKIDSSGGLMFMDMSSNTYKNISVNRTTSEMSFIDISDSSANLFPDQVYLAPTSSSNFSIFQLKYNSGSLSIIPLSSNTLYNVFGSSSVVNFTFVKQDQLNPIRPLYFSLSSDPTLPPKYLTFSGATPSVIFLGSSFCYLNYDGKQIYNPNCQFYIDMSTFMLMKEISPNVYQYLGRNTTTSTFTFSLSNTVKRENVKLIAPDILTFDQYVSTSSYATKYICINIVQEMGRNVISDVLNLNSTTLCKLGGFTQTPSPTPYVDIYSFLENGDAAYLRNKNISDLSIPYLVLSPNSTDIPDKYYIKDASLNIMIFKDDQFKFISFDESNGLDRLTYLTSLSSNTLRLRPTSTTGYTIINGNGKCLVSKSKTVGSETLNYFGFQTSTEPCVIFEIDQK
jgi:hypothetical protein